jgi:hypothetical protein
MDAGGERPWLDIGRRARRARPRLPPPRVGNRHVLGSATIPRLSLALVASLNSLDALAQNVPVNTTSQTSEEGLEELIVTGTRQSGLRAADSTAPIQLLSA